MKKQTIEEKLKIIDRKIEILMEIIPENQNEIMKAICGKGKFEIKLIRRKE